jgi:hypothetical protein
MALNTYVELDTVTVGTNTPSITFTSINQGYTDLVLVCRMATSVAGWSGLLRFNSDSGSNYSQVQIVGTGSSALSSQGSNLAQIFLGYYPDAFGQVGNNSFIVNIQNYSNATTFKTVVARSNNLSSSGATNAVETSIGTWRNTSAITSITIPAGSGNILAGSTFSLYGIKAWANTEASTFATGGYVYQDTTYWYHTFPYSGTFTPSQTLTCDILQIAGGGGGGQDSGGGGGAGGLLFFSSQSITAGAKTVTVGAGGNGSVNYGTKTNGNNSQFASLTASVGGGAGAGFGAYTASSGGSGGGASGGGGPQTGAAGTAGQGNAGGGSINTTVDYPGGGGGGAGGAGGTPATGTSGSGAGGVGVSTYSSWGFATQTGHNVDGTIWYAGGGAGNTTTGPGAGGNGGGGNGTGNGDGIFYPRFSQHGLVSTGGGGGGGAGGQGATAGGQGGSGLVIVRYAK